MKRKPSCLKFLSGEITNYNAADNWAVNVGGGSVVMEGMTIAGWRHHIWIYNSIQSVLMLGCKFGGEFNSSVLSSETENFIVSDSEVSLKLPSEIETPSYDTKKSEKVVSVLDFGASVYADDNTNAFQAAMNSLNENGGTVYVPAGNWRFSGQIVIPKNVELRGATPMQTMQNSECRKGTILWSFYSDENDKTPFITMSDDSTVNGITIYYDQQVSSNAASYPCTISVNGSSCRILNIVLTNSYNGIDIATNKADGYIIDFVSGAPINYGISVRTNTQNGIIKNCHFNPNYAYILTHNSADPNYRLYNGTAYLFGNCKNKNIYGIFAYGYKNGIEFSSQNGNGADIRLTNCSVDGSETSMRISSAANVEVINGQYVSMASENEKHGIITESNFTGDLNVYNSNIWGPSDYLLFLSGGNCNFNLVNLCTGNVDYSIYMNSGSAKFNLITFHNNNILINGKNTYADFVFCNLRTYKSTIHPSSENNTSVNQSYCYWN